MVWILKKLEEDGIIRSRLYYDSNRFLIHYTERRTGCDDGVVSWVIKPDYSSLSEQIVRVCFNHGLYSGQWTIRNCAEALPPQLDH